MATVLRAGGLWTLCFSGIRAVKIKTKDDFMSIPKKIHYVWVGGQPKSKDIQACMKTWRKHLGDYEIIEWNEKNFDIDSSLFVRQAYEQKRWAYVSDYIRAYAVYHYGGIYLDTDVLVLDDLTRFLDHRAFVGFENSKYPFTAAFGAEPGHPLVKDMLDFYEGKSFVFNSQDQLSQTNTRSVSDILIEKYDCQVNNQFQVLREDIAVYPDGVLCNPSAQSSTIHVFTGTWMDGKKTLARKLIKRLKLRLTTSKRADLYNRIIRRDRS